MKLSIEKVSKRYNDKWALRDFSTDLENGIHWLVGPNGSGKTTLMKITVGILKPTTGRVLLSGSDIDILDEKYRDLLGYLPQEFGVYRNFSAEKFLMYIAALKGIEKSEAQKKVEEVLELVNLEGERNRKLGTFSGGMKQRIGIAQALLNDPEILILDEPTSGLDPKERIRVRNLISELSGDRIILVSTHIVSDIEYLLADTLLIKDGYLIRRGATQDLLNDVKGKVWISKVNEETFEYIKEKYKVGSARRIQDGIIEVKIISDEKPFANVIQTDPGFEDMYLYYFDKESEEN